MHTGGVISSRRESDTGRSFIFLRYTLFAMMQLVQFCTVTKGSKKKGEQPGAAQPDQQSIEPMEQ